MRARIVVNCLIALLLLSGAQASLGAEKETDKYAGDEKAVRSLLDTWLKAQNTGDFAVYESCYAARFQGIRRTGKRTITFDRAGWMKDRGKMFKKPMFVQMENGALKINPGSVIVRFEQIWASGKYKDKGPKEMFLVKESGQWKIAREELLQSNVLEGARKSAAQSSTSAGGFYFNFVRLSDENALHVVMSDTGDENLPADNLRLEGEDAVRPLWDGGAMRSGIDLIVGDAAQSAMNEKFRFFTLKGAACEATLRQVELVSLETPHFSALSSLRSGETTKEEYTRSTWTNGNKVVAFHVREQACRDTDIRWAQPATAKGAASIQQPADDATFGEAVKRFRELASYGEIQNRYEKESGEQGKWDSRISPSDVKVWTAGNNPEGKMVSLFFLTGSGCGWDFSAQLWALWRVDAGGTWTAVNLGADGQEQSLVPQYALDVNGDGLLEWVAERFPGRYYFLRMEGNSLMMYKDLTIPYHDCPC